MTLNQFYNNPDDAKVIAYIVYINGIQVPVTSVSVQYGVWKIPEAQIGLVPDPVLQRLGAEDRLPVQIFYCDQWYSDTPQYRLLFDGEVVGWGYTGTTGNRAINLMCVDYIQIFTQLFFFFMSSYDDIAIGTSNQSLGVAGTEVQTAGYGAIYPYTLFSQGLVDPGTPESGTSPLIERPIDLVYNIIRALIKTGHPNRPVPATNFFAPWTRKTNFHRRFVAVPYMDQDPQNVGVGGIFPILRAVQGEQAVGAVARMAAQAGTAGSIWQMLEQILRTLLVELAMIPTPAAVSSDYQSLMPQGIPRSSEETFLTNYFVKPQMLFGIPPVSNVFFPSQISTFVYEENYMTQPTRMYFNEEALLGLLNNNAANTGGQPPSSGMMQMMQNALCVAYPEEADAMARATSTGQSVNNKNFLVWPEEYFKGPVVDRRPLPRFFTFMMNALQGGTGGAAPTAEGTPGVPAEPTESDAAQTPAQASPQRARGGSDLATKVVPPKTYPIPRDREKNINIMRANFMQNRGDQAGAPATRIHGGFDIQCDPNTPVFATVPGVVAKLYTNAPDDREGNAVQIRDALGARHTSMHLNRIDVVLGQTVSVGQQIGLSGTTAHGRANGVGSHCHHQIEISGGGKRRVNFGPRLSALWQGLPVIDRVCQWEADNVYEKESGTKVQYTVPSDAPATPVDGMTIDEINNAAYRVQHPNSAARRARQRANATQQENQGTQQVANTAETGSTGDSVSGLDATTQVAPGDTNRNLFKLYAMYEYFRERYSRRRGGLTLVFNPYVLPGFPCAVFDRRSSACDVLGYVTYVNHSMAPTGWSTAVSFDYGRTFQEMFALMQRVAVREGTQISQNAQTIQQAVQAQDQAVLNALPVPTGPIGMAPPEPIVEVGNTIQNFERAEKLYQTLFYRQAAVSADVVTLQQASTQASGSARLEAERARVEQARVAYENAQRMAQLAAQTAENTVQAQERLRQLQAQVSVTYQAYRVAQAALAQVAQDVGSLVRTVNDAATAPARGAFELGRQIGGDLRDIAGNVSAAVQDEFNTAAVVNTDAYRAVQSFITGGADGQRQRAAVSLGSSGENTESNTGPTNVIPPSSLPNSTLRPLGEVDVEASNRRAAFNYTQYFDVQSPGSPVQEIRIGGVDAVTRARMLNIVTAMRSGTVTPEDLEFLNTALNRQQDPIRTTTPDGQAIDNTQLLNTLETEFRLAQTEVNVSGDQLLVPKDNAKPLFESAWQAMRFNSRPIVTLDEYVQFLGADAAVEGVVEPGTSLAERRDFKTPAKFYQRIRRYRVDTGQVAAAMAQGAAPAAAPATSGSTGATPPATIGAPNVPAAAREFAEARAAFDAAQREYVEATSALGQAAAGSAYGLAARRATAAQTARAAAAARLAAAYTGLAATSAATGVGTTLSEAAARMYNGLVTVPATAAANLASDLSGEIRAAPAVLENEFNEFSLSMWNSLPADVRGAVDGITAALSGPATPSTAQTVAAPPSGAPTSTSTDTTTGAEVEAQTPTPVSVPGVGLYGPENRANWDDILIAYRNNVYVRIPPRA